jgi:hypothetical protein
MRGALGAAIDFVVDRGFAVGGFVGRWASNIKRQLRQLKAQGDSRPGPKANDTYRVFGGA